MKRKHIYNIIFFGFIFFLFTPYGLSTKSKLTQGLLYLKGKVISPSLKKQDERSQVGNFDINFKGVFNANDTNLNTLKGKVIFINHWATWCGPCRAEMPSLANLYQDYGERVQFMFLTNDPKKAIDRYYKTNKFNFPTYQPTSRLPDELNTNTLPATFIIDKNGAVVLEEFGPADWNTNQIRALLDKLLH